ncbi:MAG TPA: hypothetical protein VF885_25120 [Arthrobacter sp.]
MTPTAVRSGYGYKDHERHVNRVIRDWAAANGVQVSDRGAIPKTVRAGWIEAHQGLNNEVLWHNLVRDATTSKWIRMVEVLCYRCSGVHTHGGNLGARTQEHRIPHCTGEYAATGGYYIDDVLPVDENELAMVAANTRLDEVRVITRGTAPR